ncbi:MAG: RluA family pseudouridine synthase [Thermodesulfobacteriota bacterium]
MDTVELIPAPAEVGQRLDLVLANGRLPGLSRSRIAVLMRAGHVLVSGRPEKPGYRLRPGDSVRVTLPPPVATELAPVPVDFRILHEDADLIVVAKPPGVVVHPASSHQGETLVHGLLYHCRDLSGIGGVERPGIVHRLDKDTSGVMVIAKHDQAHRLLVTQFQDRRVEKRYLALVAGRPPAPSGRIALPIGRHPVQRQKMAIRPGDGREAATRWRLVEAFPQVALVELTLETGRTHQIRVHMAAIGHPVVGDRVYGRAVCLPVAVPRQLLHSQILSFCHPGSGEMMRFVAPVWPDFEDVLAALRRTGG